MSARNFMHVRADEMHRSLKTKWWTFHAIPQLLCSYLDSSSLLCKIVTFQTATTHQTISMFYVRIPSCLNCQPPRMNEKYRLRTLGQQPKWVSPSIRGPQRPKMHDPHNNENDALIPSFFFHAKTSTGSVSAVRKWIQPSLLPPNGFCSSRYWSCKR